ncbi:MAG: YfaP family protein [Methylococcales bacterium]
MKKLLCVPVWLVLSAGFPVSGNPAPDEPITLETPRAGWRTGTRENASFTQVVNYPASSVNSPENQSDTARIRGKIAGYPKSTPSPATLIVNGVAMPLKIDEQGAFDRPYAFSTGSNSVEVRTATNQKGKRVQFFDRGEGRATAKLRVLLSWDSDNTDLDLHIVTPDGAHAWYGERSLGNGGAIDVDVTTGYGPEIFASPTPLPGQYLVYVNYFGGGYSQDESESSIAAQPLTTATITVISAEGSPDEKQQSFIVPMREPGELTLVKRFSYP